MGIAINNFASSTEDRVSGAQVIDGSLRFDSSKSQYLKRTPGNAGNRKTYTFSTWIKRGVGPARMFGDYHNPNYQGIDFSIRSDDSIEYHNYNGSTSTYIDQKISNDKLRDMSGWYHAMFIADTTESASEDKFKIYVNGRRITSWATNTVGTSTNGDTFGNTAVEQRIGYNYQYSDQTLTQTYFIDGEALGPENFGFTDPLTNTWRPKKFEGNVNKAGVGQDYAAMTTTTTSYDSSKPLANLWDGSTSTTMENAGNSGTNYVTVTFPSGLFNNVTSLRVYGLLNSNQYDDRSVSVNGGSYYTPSVYGSNQWWDLVANTSFSSGDNLTEIKFRANPNSGGQNPGVSMRAIEVNGTILVQGTAAGVNGFYLPMDGNSPIGQDQSGNGTNWTPVNFGGSADITKATGAFPVLNTGNGGTVARPGVFGSEVSRNYTILGTSGGGLYRFDGITETNPPLSFVRGATYIFDYSAASSHPLAFSTTDPDSSTTSYTDGVNTATSNVTKITVPHDAPDTLYYYCTSHSNMNNAITVTTDTKKADPYAWKNVLALPLVGGSADVSDRINVGSTAKAANNNNGSATASSVASNFYNGSFYFDGNDTLRYDSLSHIGTGDFTVECWYYKTSHNSYERVVSTSTGTQTDMNLGFVLGRDVSGETSFSCGGNSVSGPTISLNTWHHLAGVRDNGVLEFFVDGVSQGTVANTTNLTNTDQIYVSGNYNGGSEFLTGYIQDVRIYDGVAKYTSNFIPASTSPDILPDTPSGVATKTQVTKITDGAVYLSGNPDELSLADSDDFNFGSGEFTVEAFIEGNIGGTRTGSVILNQSIGGASSDSAFYFGCGTDGTSLYLSTSGNSWTDSIECANSGLTRSGWHHVVWQRRGDLLEIYVDGIKQTVTSGNSAFTGSIYNSSRDIEIGPQNNSGYYVGHISNLRVIKGTALYTSNFTPPTEPLTTTSQGATASEVKLLTCQNLTTDLPTIAQSDGGLPIYNTDATGTSITSGTRTDSNSANIDIALPLNGSNGGTTFTDVSDVIRGSGSAGTVTTSGGTVTSTAQSLYYGSSAFFDGTDDYLEIPFPAISSTEPWTVEWWQYQTADMPNPCILCGQSGSSFFTFGTADGNKIGFNWRNGAWGNGNRFFSPSNELTVPGGLINKWVHIVYQRNSNYTISVFANGELLQTSSNTYEASLGSGSNTGGTLRIGNNLSSYWFSGYLQDIRIYSGVAKYGSSSFTPPTAPILTSTVSPGIVNVRGDSAVTNFNPFNTDINTVRGQEGSYATLNPITPIGSNCTFSNGNLDVSVGASSSNGNRGIRGVSTIGMTSGKWYCEHVITGGATARSNIGVIGDPDYGSDDSSGNYWIGSGAKDYIVWSWTGKAYIGSSTSENYGVGWGVGDIIGCAFDADEGKMYIYKNGFVMNNGTPSHTGLTNGPYWFIFTEVASNISVNFGQKPFKYAPPDGYQPLTSSTAKPDTVIARPDQYVSVMTYSGTNNSGDIDVTSTDTNFTPDFVWVKTRTGGNEHNAAYDSVRGANKRLLPSSGNQQVTTTANDLNAFIPGGFTMNGQNGHIYNNGYTHVAWMWKAGGAPTADNTQTSGAMTANSVSLDGVLQSAYTPSGSPSTYPKRMSIGTKQGFSIVKFVGTGNAETIPHGLSETPTFIIHKFATASSNWSIWTPHLGSNERLTFTSNGTDSSSSFQNTNSSTFNVAVGFNDNNVEMITYCWHDVPGMFKTGTYKNNASADGPFIELGFKPALFMLKCTGGGTNWRLADNTRDPFNNGSTTAWLKPSTNGTEVNERAVDFLSNGVKIRSTSGGDINQSSNAGTITYIYAAWAEEPAINLYGAQSNAR